MSFYSRNNNKGFTLIELIVSISIVAVILTVVLLNQSTYTDSLALTNLADEVSLTISQAQAYGIGVKEFIPGSNQFNYSYGLSFSLLNPIGFNKKIYLYFVDRNNDNFYNGDNTCPVGGSSECLEKFDITRDNYIYSLCVVMALGAEDCNVGRVDVSFKRPKTEAQFIFFNTSGIAFSPPNLLGARIVLKSPSGANRSVIVYNTGQISVNNTDGPSCIGTYDCGQWDGTNDAICTGNGHQCNWNSVQQKCTGGSAKSCAPLSYVQCLNTPNNCDWQ